MASNFCELSKIESSLFTEIKRAISMINEMQKVCMTYVKNHFHDCIPPIVVYFAPALNFVFLS